MLSVRKDSFPNALSELLDLDPAEPALYTNRAACYLSMRDPNRAAKDCQTALGINPGFAKAFKRLFNSYLALGDLEVSTPDEV